AERTDPGIVDEHIHLAKRPNRLRDGRSDMRLVRDAAGHRERATLVLLNLPGDPLDHLLAATGDDDCGPFLRKEPGNGFADPDSSACDESDFSVKPLHSIFLLFLFKPFAFEVRLASPRPTAPEPRLDFPGDRDES